MNHRFDRSFVLLFFILLPTVGCSRSVKVQPPVPSSWTLQSDDDADSDEEGDLTPEQEERLTRSATALFDAEAESLDSEEVEHALGASTSNSSEGFHGLYSLRSEEPWHLAAVMTDISVSASGWLGFLVQKGTPSVMTVWRRQYPKPKVTSPSEPIPMPEVPEVEVGAEEAIRIHPAAAAADLERELEPALRAALSTGRIRNESRMRENVLKAAQEFQEITAGLEQMKAPGQWWVSRFRIDVIVDGSGNVSPVVTAGAEVRLRMEWHRLMRKPSLARASAGLEAGLRERASYGVPGLGKKLVRFAELMAEDLAELSEGGTSKKRGFDPYQFRVGVGVTRKGDLGIAKTTATTIGHLGFARNTEKPVVYPKPGLVEEEPILLITDPEPVGAGRAPVAIDAGSRAMKLERNRFRKGLRKAMKISRYFTKIGSRPGRRWKIHELRTGFDISTRGKTGLVTVTGSAPTQISFYNRKF